MTTLWKMNYDYLAALSAIHVDVETGEIVGKEEADAIEMPLEAKIVNCARFVRDREAFITGMKQQKTALEARIRRAERIVERLEADMLNGLQLLDKRELEDHDIIIRTRKTARVDVLDESAIPDKFFKVKTERTLAKADIKKAIKAGETVPGAQIVDGLSLTVE